MYCGHCGAPLPDGARFCQACGSQVAGGGRQQAGGDDGRAEGSGRATDAWGEAYEVVSAGEGSVRPAVTALHTQEKPTNKAVLVAVACIAAVAVVALVAFLVLSRGGSDSKTNPSVEPGQIDEVVAEDGTTVDYLERPQLVTISASTSGLAPAPALASYVRVASASGPNAASSGSTSSDSSSTGSSSTSTAGEGGQSSDSASSATGDAGAASSGDDTAAGESSGDGASASSQGDASANLAQGNTFGSLGSYTVEPGFANVANADDFTLKDEVEQAVEANLFAVDASDTSDEFFDLYEMNRYGQVASFVTADSLMHTYHLYFSHLLKNAEKTTLSEKMLSASQSLLEASVAQLDVLRGTEWEQAALRNCAFFGVGCVLLGADASVPQDVADIVSGEVGKIQAASGMDNCAVTGDVEDYTQYKPRGYYEGDDALERYFRAMMWYGRINFTQDAQNHDDPEELNRSALLMTLALDGDTHGTPNADWEAVYTVTSFFAGASDDCGYYEYYPMFAAAYGDALAVEGVNSAVESLPGNDSAWQEFNALTAAAEAPRISSVVVEDEAQVDDDDIKGFRFMGQRFSLDESIFQQLVYDNVADRTLPSALDLPAALGSNVALSILEDEGETSYGGYSEQMETVRADLANAGDQVWEGSLYSQWLYTLNPLLVSKGEGYPSFMRSELWDRLGLQTYLGSYTELKHDTVLYSKQLMVELGGGPVDKDDRGYVQPEPELYARLASLVQATSDGLEGYGMLSDEDADNLGILRDLATQLQTISEKELAGEEPSDEEYELIRTYGGQLEHFWEVANPEASNSTKKSAEAPAAVVVDVATDAENGTVLELGTGEVSTVYVVVPIGDELHLCAGGVYSYYEFEQPQSNRLTDAVWREMLGIGESYQQSDDMPDAASWTDAFTVRKS